MDERSLFEAALAIVEPTDRDLFLVRECGDDQGLLRRVRALLASHDSAGSFLERPALNPVALPEGTSDLERPSERDDGSSDEIDLGFLEPSNEPGSLGRLGRYQIVKAIGRGAFGVVMKAFDETLHRHVAVKALDPELARTSPPRKRFYREACSAARMKHENIVQVHSVEERPIPYIVMEFVEGQTLQQRLDSAGPLELPEVVHLGRQIAGGLAAAHAQGVIHRDIKPANILIETGVERKVKITDFGLARAVDDASMTRTGTISGTPLYMAPEQALGQTVDHRADLFSLGSVLYQMTTGRPPFRAPTSLAVLKRVAEETPRPIDEIVPETPAWFCRLVDQLLAKNPAERIQSAREVADLLSRRQTSPVESEPEETRPPTAASLRPTNDPSPPPEKPTPSAPIAVPAAVLAGCSLALAFALIVVALSALLHWTRRVRPSLAPVPEVATAWPIDSAHVIEEEPTSTKEPFVWPADQPPPAIAPFDEGQAAAHQRAWAERLEIPITWTDAEGIQFVLIPPGEFQMGAAEEEFEKLVFDLKQSGATPYDQFVAGSGAPRHLVRVTKPFYLAAHETTVAQYRRFIETSKHVTSREQLGKGHFAWTDSIRGDNPDALPVIGVSWDDANAYCQWRKERDGYEVVLPSEAQWEYACRAGTTTLWSFGNDPAKLADHGVFQNGGAWDTKPVGGEKPNPFGLFDMHGNADEWCLDWHSSPFYATCDPNDPVSLEFPDDNASGRVSRGGGANSVAWWSRSSTRAFDFPAVPNNPKGFRLAIIGDLKKAVGH